MKSPSHTLAMMRSRRDVADLVEQRDVFALLTREFRLREYEQKEVDTAFKKFLANISFGFDSLSDDVNHAANRVVHTFYERVLGTPPRYRDFGAISLDCSVKQSADFSIAEPARPELDISGKSVELHIEPLRGLTVLDVARGIRASADNLAVSRHSMQAEYVTAVTYPEAVRPLLRMGMEEALISDVKPEYAINVTAARNVFYLLNGKSPNTQEEQVAGVYMPIAEFAERFSTHRAVSSFE